MYFALRTTLRHILMNALFFLPTETKIRIERHLRGREDFRKLALADCVIISFGKSGRTWLRVMISRFYQLRYGIKESSLLAFDNFYHKNHAIPRIMFSHDNYLKDFTGNVDSKADYQKSKTILLVRNPADVAVSQYYQWKFRMTDRKKMINQYPDAGVDISLYDFVISEQSGIPKIIAWMNGWAKDLDHFRSIMIMRYEDLRAAPGEQLAKCLEFIGTPARAEEIEECVRFASVENMRNLEQKRVFWLSGRRMMAGDRKNPDSFKVRRAKVGGYRDDFTPEQIENIESMISSTLSPLFGYQKQETPVA